MGFAEEGDFQCDHGAVEIGGFVEARLAVAETGQLGAEVDDGGVSSARRVLEQGERFAVELFRAGEVVGREHAGEKRKVADSQKEYRRLLELRAEEQAGRIRQLRTQVRFVLRVNGVKVGASYEPTPEKIGSTDTFISQNGEDAALRKQTYEESIGWYAGITADMFG